MEKFSKTKLNVEGRRKMITDKKLEIEGRNRASKVVAIPTN